MTPLIPLLITMASLGSQPAQPGEPKVTPECVSGTATILQRIQTMVQADRSFELRGYSQEQATEVLETFNASPPATQYRAEQVMTLVDTHEEGDKRALVMLITGGCMTAIIQTPRQNLSQVISKSIGDDA